MRNYTLGIDGGGSKTHAILMDSNKKIIAEFITGPANIKTDLSLALHSISTAINTILSQNHLSQFEVTIVVGVAGFSATQNLEILQSKLQKLYVNITIISDCHLACLAAHGGNDGAILICGTGVVGYYIQNGIGKQIGGWGFPHGDIGGGAWIGLEICKFLCMAIDGSIEFSSILETLFQRFENNVDNYKTWLLKATPQNYAEIAKLLPNFILANDPYALEILTNGSNAITVFLNAITNKTGDLPIKISGGLAKIYFRFLGQKFLTLEISNESSAIGAYNVK